MQWDGPGSQLAKAGRPLEEQPSTRNNKAEPVDSATVSSRTKLFRISKIIIPRGRRPVGDLGDLKRSIEKVGLLHPVVVTKELRLVAGLHRLRACQALGWTKIPATVVDLRRVGAEVAELDENLARRELTVLQRAEALARRKQLYELLHPETRKGVIAGRASGLKRSGGRTTATISFVRGVSRTTHLSPRTIQHEVQIVRAIPEDVRQMIHGIPLADRKLELFRLARLPHEEQRAVVREILRGKAKSVKAAESALVHGRLGDRKVFPKDKFEVVVVDPPWIVSDTGATGYPGMTLRDIRSLPVPRLAARDSVVLLWVPPVLIKDGIEILEEWGLRQVGFVVWAKTAARPGRYLMSASELCVVAIRGKPLVLQPRPNLFTAASRQHSRKPDAFYELVAKSFGGRRLDMFARESRNGWSTWGPERTKFDRVGS